MGTTPLHVRILYYIPRTVQLSFATFQCPQQSASFSHWCGCRLSSFDEYVCSEVRALHIEVVLRVQQLSLFVKETIVGYTIHGAGYTLRLDLELALPPVFMLWLYSFTQAPTCLAYRWCCWKPFLLMGKYSFCIYLLHFPIITYYAWARFGIEYWKTSSDATRLYAWEIIPCKP